jgi:curved DNA-binding protein
MSSARPDYYSILGVAKEADAAEIKKKFRRLARECHPDVSGDDPAAAARFTQLREAYETLIDPIRRDQYDNPPKRRTFYRQSWRPPGGNQFGGMGSTGGDSSRQRWRDPSNNLDLDDIFGDFSGRNPQTGRARAAGRAAPPRGDFTAGDVRVDSMAEADRSPDEAASLPGESVRMAVDVSERVARLGGTVTLTYSRLKRGEHGTSLFRYNEIYDLRLSPDTRDGAEIRVPRMGNAGIGGGAYGELVCTVRVIIEPGGGDERVRRDSPPSEGTDLDLPISLVEALLGGRVEVSTPGGRVRLTIPPCTSSGTRLRLRGRGPRGGDLYVCLRVVVPETLDEESRRLIERFAELNPDSPRD